MSNKRTLNIGWDFILKIVVLVTFLYFLFLIEHVIVWVIFALIISILFNFSIDFLERKKIPRGLGVAVMYVGVFALVGLFVYKTAPVFVEQIKELLYSLPAYAKQISPVLEKLGLDSLKQIDSWVSFLKNNIAPAGSGILKAIGSIFGGIGTAVIIISLSAFFSLEKKLWIRNLANFSFPRYKRSIFNLLPKIKRKVGYWFLSRIVGITFVGILSFVVLVLLDVEHAFILALFYGVSDFIPFIGPLIGGSVVFLLVLMESFPKAILVLVLLIIIQQLEGSFLLPVMFKKLASFPSVMVLTALAIGGELWGILGALLVVPLAAIVFELIKEYLRYEKEKEKENKNSAP